MSPFPVPCIVPGTKSTSRDLPRQLLATSEPPLAQFPASADESTSLASSEMGREPTSKLPETDEVLDGGWVQDINGMLNFNKAFVTKGMLKHGADE